MLAMAIAAVTFCVRTSCVHKHKTETKSIKKYAQKTTKPKPETSKHAIPHPMTLHSSNQTHPNPSAIASFPPSRTKPKNAPSARDFGGKKARESDGYLSGGPLAVQ
jgi:hypothetical protein